MMTIDDEGEGGVLANDDVITGTTIFSVPAFLAKLKKQRKGLKWWLWEVVVIGGPAVRAFIRTF